MNGVCDEGDCISLNHEDALAHLSPDKRDKTLTLGRALIAAWLNVLAGNQYDCIQEDINESVALFNSDPDYYIGAGLDKTTEKVFWKLAESYATTLDKYNNGLLCAPPRDTVDLSLTKTDSEDPVNAGESFVYYITVSNIGTANVSDVIVEDKLPANLTFNVSMSSSECSSADGQNVTCTIGELLMCSSPVTLEIGVDVNASAPSGVITNTASIANYLDDWKLDDNSDDEETNITATSSPP